ncbi:peptidylprolyl isomerase [Pontibacter sp. Tf4]|uniref:peptidylprolyl isomerase n=1 Tax=Pontibacter sp. Tf4 TaxID=2761620 RepID=UPI0016299D51|nr:peptidylprolyl isomerase [Pontibacter sp. Tf4]MBB6612872.1 peptidylprolyl isomerase [Pontibacter sp. Tf4]
MKKIHTLGLGIMLLSAACQYIPQKSAEPAGINKFADPHLQEIYTLQDERRTSDLLPYLQHGKHTYRREAALAFASVQDTVALPQLLSLLTDTSSMVRSAAAYAIGQIGHKKAENALMGHIDHETKPQVQAEMLEALGKIATPVGVEFLTNYKAHNPTALGGQAWGLYRAGLRQQHSEQSIKLGAKLLQERNPYEARLAAAQYLARVSKVDLTSHREQLLTTATSDSSADVRMAAAQALGKVRAIDKARFLSGIAQSDPDYRVRLSAIRSMTGLDYDDIRVALLAGLQDQNINTAVATSEFIVANPEDIRVSDMQQVLPKLLDARVRGNVIWVILQNSPARQFLSERYKGYFQNANNPYDKAQLLKALSGDFNNFKFIAEAMFAAQQPVIGTTGMDALLLMRTQPDFPKALEAEFAETMKRAIGSGDVALVGMAAGAIRDPKLNLRSHYTNYSFLTQAQQKLQLPRDMETNIELQRTIDYLNDKETVTPENPFTHPIDWALVTRIPADQQVEIRTEKGVITLQLFVEDAPGSVANFVELIQESFFDGLYFHRVVPNFVAQGGDKRGDGWGSSEYSIRSEFAPLHYREGYVGMASAGKDTESNQWFITHSPTPHLDGRYTIFAKVINGMDVVHQLEVGDKIHYVKLLGDLAPANPAP